MSDEKKVYKIMYDYSDVPTLRKFALDESRIRYVQGPFGSGKSSACVMEIVRRAHEQTPSPDGIRRSRWAVVRNCYDDQTEVLTEKRGWRLFKDVLRDERVAVLRGEYMEFEQHNGVLEYAYDGDMLGFEGEAVDFLVTPEHKMWVSKRKTRKKVWCEFEEDTAENIYGKELNRVRRDSLWRGVKSDFSLDFFEFLGFWFADGSCGEYHYPKKTARRLSVTQKKHTAYTEDLLARNKFTFYKRDKLDGSECYNYELYTPKNELLVEMFPMFLEIGLQPVRFIPQWVKDASSAYLKRFLHGYYVGDGSGGTDNFSTVRLVTCSKTLADDLQELIIKTGGAANIGMSNPQDKEYENSFQARHELYRVTLLDKKRLRPVLKLNLKHTNHLRGWYRQPYNGKVYCLNMPLVPICVRRKGKHFWCLRSYIQLRDTTIRTFHDWFPPALFGEYRVTDHTYTITKFPGVHLEVLFRALDRPEQVANLLSLELTGAWFNEVREIPKPIVDAMDGRIARYPSTRDVAEYWHGIIMDTNPPDEENWLYSIFEMQKPEGWASFKQPSGLSIHAENTKHLAKDYYKNLARGKDEMFIRVYIHGQYGFIIEGKPVFISFKDNVHVANKVLEPEKGVDVLIGFDFGLQPCCAIGQLTRYGQLRILDELVSDGMGIRQFCENQLLPLLRRKYFGMNVMGFGDPSGVSRVPTDEQTCFDVLHGKDVGLTDVLPATTNALIPRIGAVEDFLNKLVYGEPGFVLSPNCAHLRKALNGAYHYERRRGRSGVTDYQPTPSKNFASHIADSLEMLCLFVGEKHRFDKHRQEVIAKFKTMEQWRPATPLAGY